jgi:hypothetical protein
VQISTAIAPTKRSATGGQAVCDEWQGVDLLPVAAAYAAGEGTPVLRSNSPPAGNIYVDPTNVERDWSCLIPITEIEFDAKRPLILQLTPR